jgi:hypothetical protein
VEKKLPSPAEALIPTERIRRTAAINLFKRILLGDRHRGGDPQWLEVADALFGYGDENREFVSKQTWIRWMSGEHPLRDTKASKIDDVIWDILDKSSLPRVSTTRDTRRRLFSNILQGIPLKAPLKHPIGSLDRHLYALDAAIWYDGNDWQACRAEKLTRANEVLLELHTAWDPFTGWIYSGFISDWEKYSSPDNRTFSEEKGTPKLEFSPNIIRFLKQKPPKPSEPFNAPFSIYVPFTVVDFLLTIQFDYHFLVDERLDTWSIDLASVGAALIGIVFANYQNSTLNSFAKERHYADGFIQLFWSEKPNLREIVSRFNFLDDDQNDKDTVKAHALLLQARRRYRRFLRSYGIRWQDIRELLRRQWEMWPIAYSPPQ